jgi:hypothetical protein
MRPSRRFSLPLVLLALGGCVPFPGQRTPRLDCAAPSADTSGWTRIADSSGFSFLLPPGFRENKVEPVESHVRGFEAEGITLSLDYGNSSTAATATSASADSHLECPAPIGGRDAVVVLSWPDRMAYDVDAAWRDVGAGMRLWMGGAANTPNGQRALLTVLRSVRFNQP